MHELLFKENDFLDILVLDLPSTTGFKWISHHKFYLRRIQFETQKLRKRFDKDNYQKKFLCRSYLNNSLWKILQPKEKMI